ncbi:MBL fold metallo-hydrolase [Saccharopolyspora rhizosphaerae]|uniref:MBL fold metallo-hydrolase n=1 Tax=Saccharopolyspora rhizosphaerae TaxID=2492662 RepID=A0A3R8NVJ6_9PSEU|nr:MBL fold metallo-hydrolase [Saccharopolyspora rhizosphaerae]RRO14153.1 MBL fold metallo-hydrolase [Saccharopolyspora rhizosphaerae]
MGIRIDHATVDGKFSLDGEVHEVENNLWVVGDDRQCLVIDAPHDVDAVRELVADREVVAVLATHAHDDHARAAPQLADAVGAPIYLHPADRPVWELTHPSRQPDGRLLDRQTFHIGRLSLQVVHTPGHTPGSVCLYCPDLATVFTGDTLFAGGPGATGRSFSDHDAILDSIRDRLLPLPPRTRVRPGHGPGTTIGEVAAQFDEWASR